VGGVAEEFAIGAVGADDGAVEGAQRETDAGTLEDAAEAVFAGRKARAGDRQRALEHAAQPSRGLFGGGEHQRIGPLRRLGEQLERSRHLAAGEERAGHRRSDPGSLQRGRAGIAGEIGLPRRRPPFERTLGERLSAAQLDLLRRLAQPGLRSMEDADAREPARRGQEQREMPLKAPNTAYASSPLADSVASPERIV
jgi:hypothetical protein